MKTSWKIVMKTLQNRKKYPHDENIMKNCYDNVVKIARNVHVTKTSQKTVMAHDENITKNCYENVM